MEEVEAPRPAIAVDVEAAVEADTMERGASRGLGSCKVNRSA